ncbi:bromo adjacent homology domain-containing 1 protein isoform X2 [Denticeps clupeoides]|uniref:bromo adjacent homology domain-containing 1 protein isoform X2 n=1 Tax=Denticeps clupeoides TaxID=299321 RepID=UPI0010A30EE3|nr:bromo adjacent homology domain-containing 1 protein-like isoform X2 [Denticeps clupeoides]
MTHARYKGSLSHSRCEGWDHIGGWLHGDTMGGGWPEYLIKERRVKRGGAKKSAKPKSVRGVHDRKLYPLRGRVGPADSEALSCHVLLTRLDADNNMCVAAQRRRAARTQPTKQVTGCKSLGKAAKSTARADQPQAPEPRKRRLASLNAEAVNSLLLEKSEAPTAAKLARKHQHEAAAGGELTLAKEPAQAPPSRPALVNRVSSARKPQTCQSHRHVKKAKSDEGFNSGVLLDTPTPRRLAGLNAAALLKLTSSSAAAKQRAKTDGKGAGTAAKRVPHAKPRVKATKHQGQKVLPARVSCATCKKATLRSRLGWEGSLESHHLTKPGYQSRSVLGYPGMLKKVKEEQVDTELSPCYCCPAEGSVEYCHRLGLFLRQQAYAETEAGPVTSVKQECIVPSPSLGPPTLALSTHPCLCTDPCFSSYYYHVAHPGPPSGALGARSLTYPAASLCPGAVSSSKLLAPSISHTSGIPHPTFCSSVRSPCYGEACRVSTYAYRSMQPVAGKGCSYTTGCSSCGQEIKTEGYSSPQGQHSPSLLVPPAVSLAVSPSTPSVPRLLTSLADRRRNEVKLGVGRVCPQGSRSSNRSLPIGGTRLLVKQPAPSPASAKQKKVSRRRATNGWRPVGVPTEKEVFVVGEEETVIRRCFEGVERDGEVIHVRDTVLLRSGPRKKSLPYVAKISALWEDPKTGENLKCVTFPTCLGSFSHWDCNIRFHSLLGCSRFFPCG